MLYFSLNFKLEVFMKSLIILLILSPLTLFASQDYYVSNTFAYSTTAEKIIQQVNTSDDSFFNFIECDLVLDLKGDFEGYSKSNCKLVSNKWLYLDEVSATEATKRFSNTLEEKSEGSYFGAITFATVSVLTGTIAYNLYRSHEKALTSNHAAARVFGALFFAVASTISAAIAYFNYEPSIETILSDSEIMFNSSEDVRKASHEAYELIQDSLKETLNQMGVSLSV